MATLPRNVFQNWDVLLIDDDEDSLNILEMALTQCGATVYRTYNGAEGLEKAQIVQPHFVITDIYMPHLNGWDFIKRMKENLTTSHIPVVALTAYASIEDRGRAFEAGFVGYISKPILMTVFIYELVRILSTTPTLHDNLATLFKS